MRGLEHLCASATSLISQGNPPTTFRVYVVHETGSGYASLYKVQTCKELTCVRDDNEYQVRLIMMFGFA